jgi:cytochrome c5
MRENKMKNLFWAILLFAVNATAQGNNLGKTTYEIACQNCHAPKVAVGLKAPAAFDKKAWNARFKHADLEAKNNPTQFKSTMAYLLYSVTIGKGLMHHGGLCKEADIPNKNCSDEALIQAIHYMSQR